MADEKGLTNHEITIALVGGALLGPFRATWSTEILSDVRELTKDYDAFLQGEEQKRFRRRLSCPGLAMPPTCSPVFLMAAIPPSQADLRVPFGASGGPLPPTRLSAP